ncbi:MAG: O-antigen ligase family protein [Candidatus Electrothrix sp. GW3-4]|uniref:O-antigen ligase family protein n=1 Tax=Candidatus Electrothrix sp. GW3-4 TaxID=3126740 RepID=UPI0030D30102
MIELQQDETNDIRWEQDYFEYPYVSKYILLIFCSYVLIWYLQVGTRINALGAIRIELIVASILIPLAFTTHSKSNTKIQSPLLSAIVVYFLLLFIMTLFSYDFDRSWNVFFNRIIKFSFMAIFITCFVKSPNGMRFFIAAFMLACMKMGQEGLVGQITGGLVWQNQGVMRLHGATMMYRHPNSFSGMALGTVPFILYLYPIVNKWCKALLLMQLVFALNIILHTGSRTGYIGFFGILLISFLRSQHKLKVILFLLVTIIPISNFIPEQYKARFQSIYKSSHAEDTTEDNESLHGGDSSKAKRIQILTDAVEIFITHPCGIGVSAFPSIRNDVFGRKQDTHNLYLEIATNVGIQGIIIIVVVLYKLFRTLFNCRKELLVDIKIMQSFKGKISNDILEKKTLLHSKDVQFLIAICDSVILFVALRLFLGLFGMDLYEIYWWFAFGLTLSVSSMLNRIHYRTSFLEKAYLENN